MVEFFRFDLVQNRTLLGYARTTAKLGLKARVRECYPDRKEGYFPVAGGQLFRFVHEVKTDDYAVYPSKQDRNVHIGEIVGPYEFDPKSEPGYPQRVQN